MNILTYARVSTEEQAEQGKSIETQSRLAAKWAKEGGHTIIKSFVDEGKSATTLQRPALQEMLAYIQQSDTPIDALIVQDTDRLARNTLDHLTLKALLKKQGIKVISLSQPMLDDSPEGSLIDTIIASVNAFQSQITGRKTSKVMEEKAALGWYPGGTPALGYRVAENPRPTGSLDKRIIAIDEVAAPHIQEIYRRYATGRYTMRDIGDYLNEKGIRSPRGNKMHMSYIALLLKDRFYLGTFMWKGKEWQGKHPPLIDPDTHAQVQRVIASHNKHASRARKHIFLLRGYAYCNDCKGRYNAEHHKKPNGKTYDLYFCNGCKKDTYVDQATLESQVEKVFDSVTFSSDFVAKVMKRAKELVTEYHATEDRERRQLIQEKAKLEKGMQEAEGDRFIHKSLSPEMFVQIYGRFQDRLKEIDMRLSTRQVDHSKKIMTLHNVLSLAENIGNAYKTADETLKKGYLSLFIKRLSISKDKIVKYELTDALKSLIARDVVLISKNGLPIVTEVRRHIIKQTEYHDWPAALCT